MNRFQNCIISASAGTGKTYRLSLEYIALILSYYKHDEALLESILALTFTKKATAEIRERIVEHLQTLLSEEEKREILIHDLRKLVPGAASGLSIEETNILQSAYYEICVDQSKLQVMTIDSYISGIFRNIVRPLRSIDRYEIDLGAVDKRMPYLMNHLMKPAFRDRINRLLVRKVNRSMDDYAEFFKSLIQNRWLYFLITHRCKQQRAFVIEDKQELHDAFLRGMQEVLELVFRKFQLSEKGEYLDFFNSDFRNLFTQSIFNAADMLSELHEIRQNPQDSYQLLKVLAKKKIFNGTRIRDNELKASLHAAQVQTCRALADCLYLELFIPEQEEILDIWHTILAEYDRLIYRYKNMTYDDISWFSFEALFSQEPPNFDLSEEITATEFYEFLSHRTRFMLIDEFQDTSLIQFNILKPIIEEITSGIGSKPFGGIIVVGDEKQSIFGWRGGERDLLLNLKGIFPALADVKTDRLEESWRSSHEMMNFINYIFAKRELHHYLQENKMSWHYEPVTSAIGTDKSTTIELKCKGYSTRGTGLNKQEVLQDFVSSMILPVLQKSPNEKIAILCRKGNQLSQLQLSLEEAGITSIFQPSDSLVNHLFVAPLLQWLRFVAYQDWLDLLGFLRSDFIRIHATLLKQVADIVSESEKKGDTPDFKEIPAVERLYKLSLVQTKMGVYQVLRDLIDLCLTEISLKERDYLNIQAFLSICKNWELSNSADGNSIADFLSYVSENKAQDTFMQASLEGDESIQLLTIHKSKGLQFDRVFVFYDLSSTYRERTNKLNWVINYADDSFHDIDAYTLSCHYEEVLRYSSAMDLWEASQRRVLLEELNTLYVAFTRAKTALHVYFSYLGMKGWSEYFSEKECDDLKLPTLLANTCIQYFADSEVNEDGIYQKVSSANESADNAKPKPKGDTTHLNLDQVDIGLYRSIDYSALQSLPAVPIESWKSLYLDVRQHLIGDIAHYYLSFILRDTDDEHRFAYQNCIARFGSLLPVPRISRVIEACIAEIRKLPFLFDRQYDKVFTEFEVIGKKGTLRIDRLMIDNSQKKAQIIDFKTGRIDEPEQLDIYEKALAQLPAFKHFSFIKKYVSINIGTWICKES